MSLSVGCLHVWLFDQDWFRFLHWTLLLCNFELSIIQWSMRDYHQHCRSDRGDWSLRIPAHPLLSFLATRSMWGENLNFEHRRLPPSVCLRPFFLTLGDLRPSATSCASCCFVLFPPSWSPRSLHFIPLPPEQLRFRRPRRRCHLAMCPCSPQLYIRSSLLFSFALHSDAFLGQRIV